MAEAEMMLSEYTIKPLGPDTWEAFAQLAARHNGVWNGCWCTWFHASAAERGGQERTAESNRAFKEGLVCQGRAHVALVFDGAVAVAWCEYGSPAELLPGHRALSSTTARAVCSRRLASVTSGPRERRTA